MAAVFIQVAAKSDGGDFPQYRPPSADLQISVEKAHFTYSETVFGDSAQVVAKLDSQGINEGTRRIVAAVWPDGKEIPFVLIFERRD